MTNCLHVRCKLSLVLDAGHEGLGRHADARPPAATASAAQWAHSAVGSVAEGLGGHVQVTRAPDTLRVCGMIKYFETWNLFPRKPSMKVPTPLRFLGGDLYNLQRI